MDVIKFFTVFLLFVSTVAYGQKSIYPKDTIYILFDKKKHAKKILNHPESERNLYFKNIGVYYDYRQKADTLCTLHLKDYKVSNLKEVREKHHKWIFENKRPPADKNGVFQTYLIEVISENYFVVYPVIWTRE